MLLIAQLHTIKLCEHLITNISLFEHLVDMPGMVSMSMSDNVKEIREICCIGAGFVVSRTFQEQLSVHKLDMNNH